MKTDNEDLQMGEKIEPDVERELIDRRAFLRGLGKWSLAVIGCVTLGSAASAAPKQTSWVNRRGGYGGGGAWANRAGGGGAWANRAGGGGAWVNRRGY